MSFSKNLGRNLGRAARILVDTTVAVGNATIDIVDEALKGYADKKMEKIIDAQHEAAMANEEYAEIQKRRDEANKGNEDTVILSGNGITIDDWFRQSDIASEVSPEPATMNLYRLLYSSPLHRTKNQIKFAYQRLTRSWDDMSTWSLDTTLCATLGAQLKHLAVHTHGSPIGEEFPTHESWAEALNSNAEALIAYGTKWDADLTREEEEAIYKKAQESLRWVADHLGNLWD